MAASMNWLHVETIVAREVMDMPLLKRRVRCLLIWPVLLLLDAGIVACGVCTWEQARAETRRDCMKAWSEK
jgi:hypothetical protein